ncbi:MAG TPA: histidine phosphatase family protein, partial [Candidatus Thermoplasmatota archaeon]|nr:histidine phosphatase family protein [Candidatus Thermoplasmatota archaeon]
SAVRLHVIRHGETAHNVVKRIQGDLLDDPLNDVGRAQAAALARWYAAQRARGTRVAAVYASPLRRAWMTAAPLAKALGLPGPVAVPALREVGWGAHMGQVNDGATREAMERVLEAWRAGDLAAAVVGGESALDAWARVQAALQPLLARHAGDEDVVLVAHGRLNKVLLGGLVDGDLRRMEDYPQANAGVTVVEGPAPWRVAALNRTDHLSGLRALDERAG